MPKIPAALFVVGLINAIIAAVAPFLSSGQKMTWVVVIAIIGAVASAIVSYVGHTRVKKALAAAAKAAPKNT